MENTQQKNNRDSKGHFIKGNTVGKGYGRPSKMTSEWLDIARDVLEDDINSIILTDEDLVFLINEKFRDKGELDKVITQRTFENWKRKIKEASSMTKGIEEIEEKEGEIVSGFFRIYKKALIKQTRSLFEDMRTEDKNWQRYAWILERKFDDWNIRHKVDETKTRRLIVVDSED